MHRATCTAKQISATVAALRPTNMLECGLSTRQYRSRSTRRSHDRKAQTATNTPDNITCHPGSSEPLTNGRQVTAQMSMLNTAIARRHVHHVQTFFESLTPVPSESVHLWPSEAA